MLESLIDGSLSREQVADWAAQWVIQAEPPIEDEAVWDALVSLSGADLLTTDRPYLDDFSDFERWLAKFRRS